MPPLDDHANGEGDDLRIYSNPANHRVNIVADVGLFGKRGVIDLFDVKGKRIHSEQVALLKALQTLEISSEWHDGPYLVMLRVEGHSPRSARIVIRRCPKMLFR